MQAEWVVPTDHPAFAGHFPGRPILPGVVMLDWVLLLARQTYGRPGWDIVQAKFLRTVDPGAALRLRLMPTPAGALGFEVRCGDALVASGTIREALP